MSNDKKLFVVCFLLSLFFTSLPCASMNHDAENRLLSLANTVSLQDANFLRRFKQIYRQKPVDQYEYVTLEDLATKAYDMADRDENAKDKLQELGDYLSYHRIKLILRQPDYYLCLENATKREYEDYIDEFSAWFLEYGKISDIRQAKIQDLLQTAKTK